MNKKHASYALACAALTSSVALAAPEGTLTYSQRDGCDQLPSKDCSGERNRLQWRTPSGTGFWTIGVEEFNDQAGRVAFDKGLRNRHVGEITGRLDWNVQLEGVRMTADRSFQLGPNSHMQFGIDLGKVKGNAGVNVDVDARFYGASLTIPAFDIRGRQFAGETYTFQPRDFVLYDSHSRAYGETPYGGISQSMGAAIPLGRHVQLAFSQSARVGVERMSAGLCGGIMFTSNRDSTLGSNPDGLCSAQPIQSRAGYALSVAFGATRIFKDVLYDAELKRAGRIADSANERIGMVQNQIDRIEDRTSYGYTLPTYTGNDVLNFLGVDSPYRVSKSINLGASVRFGLATAAIAHSIPLGKANQAKTTVAVSLDFE